METTLLSQPALCPTPPPSLCIFGSGITNPKAAENRSRSLPSVFFFFRFVFFYDGLEKHSWNRLQPNPPSVTESQPWAIRKETTLIKEDKFPNLNSVTTIFSPAMLRFKVRNLTHPSCHAHIYSGPGSHDKSVSLLLWLKQEVTAASLPKKRHTYAITLYSSWITKISVLNPHFNFWAPLKSIFSRSWDYITNQLPFSRDKSRKLLQ